MRTPRSLSVAILWHILPQHGMYYVLMLGCSGGYVRPGVMTEQNPHRLLYHYRLYLKKGRGETRICKIYDSE
jgi:hypothetical protein